MNKILYLNKEIYDKQRIYMAINNFQNVAEVEVNEEKFYFVCEFCKCRYSTGLTIKEFENYLISLTNKGKI